MKRFFMFLAVFHVLLSCAFAESPEWDYPLSPLIIRDAQNYLTLANKDHLLDPSYVPEDLVSVTARHVSGRFQLRLAAHQALIKMFDDAKDAGITLYVKSAYRSYQTQKTMYSNRLEKNNGKDDGWVSYPGASDHQTGLGLDVLNYAWSQKDGMNAEFAKTKEAQWMAEHCHEYGFIIRYQEDKQDITGINYEPWHLRYVGKECAEYMTDNHLCLEEFTDEWQAYLADYQARGGDFAAYCRQLTTLPDPETTGIYDDSGDAEVSFFMQ